MQGLRRAAVGAAVTIGVISALTGCSSGGGGGDGSGGKRESGSAGKKAQGTEAPGTEADAGADTAVAETSGERIGAKGTKCVLPVTFELARGWKPEAVKLDRGGNQDLNELAKELAEELGKQGPVTIRCEIDAKPAGNIGFLRVWTGRNAAGGNEPRAVLKAFLADQDGVRKSTYRQVEAGGGLAAAEVDYTVYSKLTEETKQERALAVRTPSGPVVIHLGGMDNDEHKAMLPAYELARTTMAAGRS